MRRRVLLTHVGALGGLVGVALVVMATPGLHVPPQPIFPPDVSTKVPALDASGPVAVGMKPPPGRVRAVAGDLVAPPQVALATLERVAARPPLGDLGLAAPPRRVSPDEWEGTLLYRPTVTSSASFVAMGYTIYIAGAVAVEPDQTCDFEGVRWPCGERAMLAFRYFLRGRAPLCQLLPTAERLPIAAACKLGKQDVGAWLVANGWAHARPGGGYEKAEGVAKHAKMGVFGPPD